MHRPSRFCSISLLPMFLVYNIIPLWNGIEWLGIIDYTPVIPVHNQNTLHELGNSDLIFVSVLFEGSFGGHECCYWVLLFEELAKGYCESWIINTLFNNRNYSFDEFWLLFIVVDFVELWEVFWEVSVNPYLHFSLLIYTDHVWAYIEIACLWEHFLVAF